jgi:hypothetical protein
VEQRKNIPTGKYRIIVLFGPAESRLNTIGQFLLLFAEILNRVNMSTKEELQEHPWWHRWCILPAN